jgi:hypothetical protein
VDELEKDGSKKKGKGKGNETYGQPVLDFYGNANPKAM